MTPTEQYVPIPFRVRIGITGLRKLPDAEGVRKAVQLILKEEIEKLFDTKSRRWLREAGQDVPLLFAAVTSLADGTDQTVAAEIADTPANSVMAVLPLEHEEYRDTVENKQEFDRLLKQDREPRRLRHLKMSQEFADRDLENKRNTAYDAASRYMVDHCDVLIAVMPAAESLTPFTPHQTRKPGDGTRITVEYARKRKRPIIIVDIDHPSRDTTIVERGKGLNARAVPALREFNNLTIDPHEERQECEGVAQEIFGGPKHPKVQNAASGLPDVAREAIRRYLIPAYVRTDRIAKKNQSKFQWAGIGVYILAILAVVCVAVGVIWGSPNGPGSNPDPVELAREKRTEKFGQLTFTAEFVCLAAILLIVFRSRKSDPHQKWIESRFLAERLRSGFYLAACGLESSPVEVPPYLGVSHQPDDWMVRAYEEIWRHVPSLPKCVSADGEPYKAFLSLSWVNGQISYHKRKAKRCERMDERLTSAGITVFCVALVAALLHASGWFHGINDLLSLTAITFPAIGASLAGIRTLGDYERLAKSSHQMATTLEDLLTELEMAHEPGDLENRVRQVEELMLRETQEWLMLVRFVKLETP